MGFFAIRKAKKKREQRPARLCEVDDAGSDYFLSCLSSSSSSPRKKLESERPSFRKTARAIQNAQRFIRHSNPRLQPSNISQGQTDAGFPEQGAGISKPMPLPSPMLSPPPSGYALPGPLDHTSALTPSPNALIKNASAGHAALRSRVFPWEIRPLPSFKHSFAAPKGLKHFSVGEVETACQHLSHQSSIGDDGLCFNGTIPLLGKTGKQQQQQRQQGIVILCLHENLHLGLKEWLPEMYSASYPLGSHVCKLIGFCSEDGLQERYLVYEKLARGSLHSLLFELSDTRLLDWSTRIKIMHGAIAGLASLQERFPQQALYRDFRLSHIQCDSDYNAKVSGYWFVTSSSQIIQNHVLSNSSSARDNAYCAPETIIRGVLTWKSNVWSLGVVMLELLCGRQNSQGRMVKDEKHNVVQWARPFLVEEDKVFLVMDPKLRGCFPSKGAKAMANLILQCLHEDPEKRPSMKMVLEMIKAFQEPRQTNPTVRKNRVMNEKPIMMSAPLAYSSPKSAVLDRNMRSYNRTPMKFDLIESPRLKPLVIPARYVQIS